MTVINSNVAETLNISENGTYDVSNYTGAVVNTPVAPEYCIDLAVQNSTIGPDTSKTSIGIDFTGIEQIFDYIFAGAYTNRPGYSSNLTGSVDMSDIKTIGRHSCDHMFHSGWSSQQAQITSLDLSNLTQINQFGCYRMCDGCRSLTTVKLDNLANIKSWGANNMFVNCPLTSISMPALYSIDYGSESNEDVYYKYGYGCKNMCGGTNITSADLRNLTYIGNASTLTESSCEGMFGGCINLTSVNLSSLTKITGKNCCYRMFSGCTSLPSIDLSSLTTLEGTGQYKMSEMFKNCTSLRTVDLSGLTSINGSYAFSETFYGCTALETVDLSGLTSVPSNTFVNTFSGCTNLTTIVLNDKLVKRNPPVFVDGVPILSCLYEPTEYITVQTTGLCRGNNFATANMHEFELVNVKCDSMFANNTSLTDIKFPVLTRWNTTSSAANMFNGCTNANFTHLYFPMLCVFRNAVPFTTTSFPNQLTVHFRKDQQTTIMATSSASSNFGALALVFDLIGTITVNGNDYIRQGKMNETGYYAWQKVGSKITVGGVDYTFDINEITRNSYGSGDTVAGPILYGWKNGSTTYFTESLNPQVGDFIYPAFNQAQSDTLSISAVDTEFVYTADSAEPDVGDTVYSDTGTTSVGTISAVA